MPLNLDALIRCLPICDLEAYNLGDVRAQQRTAEAGYTPSLVTWVEPPAAARVPYVDPVLATSALLQRVGHDKASALAVAQAQYAALRPQLSVTERVRYLDDFEPDSPEHIPGDRWLEHLHSQACVPADLLAFLRKTWLACAHAPAFNHPSGEYLSLDTLPRQPPENSLIQFQPGCPWMPEEDGSEPREGKPVSDWMRWRAWIGPHAAAIEARWGRTPVYLADPQDKLDDDLIHRFLVLHWCCTCRPESAYVQFLLEASGATSVRELQEALLAPEHYAQPFAVQNVFSKMEPCVLRFVDDGPEQKVPYVTIALEHAASPTAVQRLLMQQVGADVLLIDVNGQFSVNTMDDINRYARHFVVQHGWDKPIDDVIEVLARTDRLHLVEGPNTKGGSTDLSPPLMQLMGLAVALKVKTHFHVSQGGELWNFMDRPAVKAAIGEAQALLEALPPHLNTMDEIHVWCDFAATGLWNKRGAMLAYDTQVLPRDLIRRLSAWQWDHDFTYSPPEHMGTDVWWDEHEAQGPRLANEVQQAVGPQVRVMVHAKGGPVWVGDLKSEAT